MTADWWETIEFEGMLLGRHLTPLRRLASGEDRLERSAYTLLSRLDLEGPMSIGQLSEAFLLDTSTLNRQTAAMMRAGLVERIGDPAGGLARKFQITDDGRRRLQRDRRANVAGLQSVLAEWAPQDLESLATLLRRMNHDLERAHGRPWPRA